MRKSMSVALGHRPRAGEIIGYWKGDRPIYLGAGGSTPPEPPSPSAGPPAPVGIPVNFPPPAPTPPQAITSEDLARLQAQWQADADARIAAREAELQTAFDARLAPFEQERAEREAEAQRAAEAAAEAERQRLAAEETAAQRIERIQQETNARLAQYESQLAERDEVLRRERERAALMEYRSTKLAENAQTIHPAMHELVGGFTQAEIDASITRAQAATAKVVDEFAAAQGQQQQTLAALQRAQPGTSVTQPAAGPIEALGSQRTLSPEELKRLSPQEYEAIRPQLLAAANAAYYGTNGQG